MAEGITIPSPSVFLRQSPPPTGPISEPAPRPAKQHVRRPSKETKKPTSKKGNPSVTAAEGGVVKPKQSKSRNGCVTCKAKRLKCGEEKPTCHQCARRNVECGGYKKDFKWRPFEETNVKLNIDRQKQATSPKWHLALAPPKSASPPTETHSKSPEVLQDHLDAKSPDRSSPLHDPETHPPTHLTPPAASPPRNHISPQDSVHASPIQEQPDPAPPPDEDAKSRAPSEDVVRDSVTPPMQAIAHTLTPIQSLGNSPTLTAMLHPLHDVYSGHHQDFVNFSMPEDMQLPLMSSAPDHIPLDEELLIYGDGNTVDCEEIVNFGNGMWPVDMVNSPFAGAQSVEQAMALWPQRASYIYQQPSMPQDSMESLTARFDQMTCGILSVMDGPSENPWRNLIWPLAQQSPALRHAIAAMAAFHSSSDIPSLRIKGGEHKAASLHYICEGIRENSISDETAIATALALGFSESWDQHTATGNTHIKGAQVLVKRALDRHQRNPLCSDELARLKFLCNAWVYMDVIARLTSFDSDESMDFDSAYFFTPETTDATMVTGAEGFGINFGMPIDARLDPLMGCANTLFPLIGRVANLVRKVYRTVTNSPAVISQANDLKDLLERWRPPEYIERPEDPTTDVQHTLQTAEAYRWATLLHLHQSVPEIPSVSSTELAQRVLRYLATVPPSSRTTIVHIYPLMVAGCEAAGPEDRDWVRERWAHMGRRLRIGVVEKCVKVTDEVWRRRDAYEAHPRRRGRVVATADLQPLRQQAGRNSGSGGGTAGTAGSVKTEFIAAPPPPNSGMLFGLDAEGNAVPPRMRMKAPDQPLGFMDFEYSVRGHLHWVAVMWEWQWESTLLTLPLRSPTVVLT